MTTPDAAPPPGEVPPAAEAQSNPAAAPSDATPAPDTAADTGPAAAAAPAATDTPAGEGGASSAARDMSLSALDISIPSVSSIGKKKGPTPPPTPPPEVEKEPAKHPPGVFSVYLTQDTALSVGVDRDDAKHESLQLVPARKVFEDIKTRGPASEFYPLKGQLQNYWEPNFTFRFINDDRYLNNDNFEIYATYDAREKLLADIAVAIAIKEELEGPRVWKNLGSDVEVDRENVKPSRPPILMRASRRRDDFFQKFQLRDRDALETWSSSQMECRPFKDPSFDKFFTEQDVAVTAISIVADKGSQTIQQRARSNFAQYEFRQFDLPTMTKAVRSVDMGLFLKFSKPLSDTWMRFNKMRSWICTRMILPRLQMKIINLGIKQPPQLRSTSHSLISHMAGQKWCQQLIGCLVGTGLLRQPSLTRNLSMKECRLLESPVILMFLFGVFWIQFTPRWLLRALLMFSVCVSTRFAPCWLLAGAIMVILWDLTAAQETVDKRHKRQLEDKSETVNKKKSEKAVLVLMCLLSSAKQSHSSIVSDIHWLPEDFQMSVKGQMVGNRGLTNFLASVSADGKVTFWDVTSKVEPVLSPEWSDERKAAAVEGEKYKWNPVVEIILASLDPVKQVGPLKMAIRGLAGGGTQFYCSTEFGEILNADVTSPSGDNIKSIAHCHHGPVRALLASPFFKTVLLSIGIWTFALWKDNVKEPIFVSRCAEGYLTTGCWSPTRPAVIYIGLIDGTVEVWDLLDHSHQPSMIATVCSCQLTVMEFWRISSPQFLAVGDIQGILHILEIPRSLRRTSYKEKVAMGNFFARQQAWVADVKNRSKEREKQIEKAMAQKAILKEREEQFFKLCTWTQEMETEYQKYESDCRVKFGAKFG